MINLKQGDKEMEKLPKGALRLVEVGDDCCAFAVAGEEGEAPKMKMIAYSGGIIKNHWYWGNLAIDLEGMTFPVSKYPILEDHRTDKKIAFTGKPIINDNTLSIDPDKTVFVDTPESAEFQKLSSQTGGGFPYQASIYAKPSSVERVMEGESAKVNGMSVRGPASIWRKCEFKEASVCVFGWDSKTQSSAFSKTEMEDIDVEYIGEEEGKISNEDNKLKKEVKSMDLAELKKEHPELIVQLSEEVTASVTEALTADFNIKLAEKDAELSEKDAKLDGQTERLASLEKKEVIRTENDLSTLADRIWTERLAKSELDERLYEKAQNMVSHAKFVKDDVLDVEAFTKAVDVEIKDWEDRIPTPSVMGFGKTSKTSTSDTQSESDESDQKLADEMANSVGVETT